MQIVRSLLVCAFLAAGILSSTDAQYNTPGEFGTLGQPATEFTELMNKTCFENGGPDALMIFEKAGKEVISCINNVQAGFTTPGESVNIIFEQYCAKVPAFKSCLRRYVDPVKKCFKQDERKDIDMIYRIAARTLDFSCDNSEQITKLVSSTFSICLLTKGEEMKTCVEKIIPFEATTTLTNRLTISTDEDGCGHLESVENCTVNVLHGCEDKLGSELLHSLFKTINNEILCTNLEKSYASSASVVNIALLIAALAISL